MDFRRQSSLHKAWTVLRVWGMCWATCLVAVSTAAGQTYDPMGAGGAMYGDPTMGSIYSPAGPQAAFGPMDAGYGGGSMDPNMMGADPSLMGSMDPSMGYPPAHGMPQFGGMHAPHDAHHRGGYGGMPLHGHHGGKSALGHHHGKPATWAHVRDLQMGVYTNEEQTVINGGSTFEFFATDRYGIGGRVLLGGANNDKFTDEFHFSGDLYGGTTRIGEHWVKGGVLYDIQDNFHKVGPTLGALLFADRKHPISLDVAYGIGYGDPIINTLNNTKITVPDDDVQLRAGTYLTPNLQTGFSGQWINFADSRFEDYNTYGGFVSLNYGVLGINVDVTHGDGRTRGFVNVAYTFGGRRARPKTPTGRPCLVEHPRDWLTKPILRDVSLQMDRASLSP